MGIRGVRCNRPLTQWEIQYIASSLNIDPMSVQRIYREFVEASGRDGLLSPREFRKLYKRLYPASRMTRRQLHHFTKKVYRYCDRDGSGKLTFNEFIAVLVMVEGSGTPRDKMDFVFKCMSPSGQIDDSYIDMNDVRYLSSAMDNLCKCNYSNSICNEIEGSCDGGQVPYSVAMNAFEGAGSSYFYNQRGLSSSSDYSSDDCC